MNGDENPLAIAVGWLAVHANFPGSRLTPAAEALVCVAALAAAELAGERGAGGAGGKIQRKDAAQTAALRAHAMRRSQVHYKCDNSAKV